MVEVGVLCNVLSSSATIIANFDPVKRTNATILTGVTGDSVLSSYGTEINDKCVRPFCLVDLCPVNRMYCPAGHSETGKFVQ